MSRGQEARKGERQGEYRVGQDDQVADGPQTPENF